MHHAEQPLVAAQRRPKRAAEELVPYKHPGKALRIVRGTAVDVRRACKIGLQALRKVVCVGKIKVPCQVHPGEQQPPVATLSSSVPAAVGGSRGASRAGELHEALFGDAIDFVAGDAAHISALGHQQKVVPFQEAKAAEDAIGLRTSTVCGQDENRKIQCEKQQQRLASDLGNKAQPACRLVAGVDLLQELSSLALRVGCGVLYDLEGGSVAVKFQNAPRRL